MTDKQPEALRLAEMLTADEWPGSVTLVSYARECVAELLRLHAENETLRAGYAAARLEIESLRKEHADEPAVAYMCGASREKEIAAQQPGAAGLIGALEDAQRAINSMKVEAETAAQGDEQMMLEACETISNEGLQADMAIRAALASHGQAPADAKALAEADRRAGEAERILATCKENVMRFEQTHSRMKYQWGADQRVSFGEVWDEALALKKAAQAAPAYKDSTPELHIGDSAFESWYSTYSPAHKADKQRARDAYAAGMGDPLVTAAPAAVAGPVVNRATVIEWLDANDIEVTDRQMDGLFHFAAPTTQPSPAVQGDALDAEVLRDAERYRFIRDVPYSDDVRSVLVHQQNAAMDRVIDAARAAQEDKSNDR